MIHRIFIEHHNPATIIKVLKAYTEEIVKTGKLPPHQSLEDDRPYVVGQAITYNRRTKA